METMKYSYNNNQNNQNNQGNLVGKRASVIVLALSLVFMFYNNHNALYPAGHSAFYIVISILSWFGVFSQRRVRMNFYFKWLSILFIAVTISNLYTMLFVQLEIDRGYYLSYLLLITMMISLSQFKFDNNDIKIIENAFIISVIIISFLIVALRHTYYSASIADIRYNIQVPGHENIDPNFLAAYMTTGIIIMLNRVQLKENRMRVCYIFMLLISIIALIMTGSRGAILALAVGGLIMFWNQNRGSRKIIIIVIAIVLILIIYWLVNAYLPQYTVSRINVLRSIRETGQSRRLLDWEKGWEAVSKSPFFGYGTIQVKQILSFATGYAWDAHNTIICVWLQCGILGLISYVAMILHIVKRSVTDKNVYVLAIAISNIMTSFLLGAQLSLGLWISMFLCALHLEQEQ